MGDGGDGRRDVEDRGFVGNLVLEDDFGEVGGSIHKLGGRYIWMDGPVNPMNLRD